MTERISAANPFHQWVRLEQPRYGSRVVYANDEFFGARERLIQSADPVFIPDRYDDHGKWMDGWETRRRREPGHDWCIIRLGLPGIVRGLDIDTSYFTGNFPPAASVDGCLSDEEVPSNETHWLTLLPETALEGDSHHFLPVDCGERLTHLRLNIFPDGGVARLRVYGEVKPDWTLVARDALVDLAAVEYGGRALVCSDEHFGSMHNLNAAGRGLNMGDGWETARRRGPGHDWVVLALGHPGIVEEIEIDTAHFKGNYPARASIQATNLPDGDLPALARGSDAWPELMPAAPLSADAVHVFRDELSVRGVVSHVRLNIFPDGGVSRLRVRGRPAEAGA